MDHGLKLLTTDTISFDDFVAHTQSTIPAGGTVQPTEEITNRIVHYDFNNDQRLSFDEYKAMNSPSRENYCPSFTDLTICLPQRGCFAENGVCRNITDVERLDYSWDRIVTNCTDKGYVITNDEIPIETILIVFVEEHPPT